MGRKYTETSNVQGDSYALIGPTHCGTVVKRSSRRYTGRLRRKRVKIFSVTFSFLHAIMIALIYHKYKHENTACNNSLLTVAACRWSRTMNFTSLRYFMMVAEELNVTRAAKRLYITQQSLSAHIAALEKDLGIKLFERSPAFSLTYAGTRLELFAGRVLDLERQIYSEMGDIAGHRRGAVRIGISHTCGLAILPRILPAFYEKNPLIEVTVLEGNSAELEDYFKHGQIDMMIVFTPIGLESMEIIPLAFERLLLLVPKRMTEELFGDSTDYMRGKFSISADITRFQQMPFILLKKGNRVRSMIDNYTSAKGVKLNIRFETENTETAYALARSGMGIAVYPELFLKYIHSEFPLKQDEKIDYFPITDASASETLAVCYDRSRYLSNAARDFIEIACSALHE